MEARESMKILICISMIPWPVAEGLCVRIFNLSKELARCHEVHLFCLSVKPPRDEQKQAIADAGLSMTVVNKPAMPLRIRIVTYLKSLLRGVPPELIFSWEDLAFTRIREIHREQRFDAVMAEHLFMGRFALQLDCPRLLDEHNVEGELMAALARREKLPLGWFKRISAVWIGRYEKKLLMRMQAITAVSGADAEFFGKISPDIPVILLKNGVGIGDYPADFASKPRGGHNLLFVGLMSFLGNAEAAEWFTAHVLSLVRERHADTTFTIVGKDPLSQVKRLDDGAGIRVTGFVDDVRPYYRDSSVMVVPLLMGGGSRLKILESFAAGTPVVSTTKGAEGLEVENGRHLLIADTPEDFANAVIRLLDDEELYRQLQSNARELVVEKYDWRVLAKSLEEALTMAVREGKTE